MQIVILDGYTENPGDLRWDGFEQLGALTVYDRTPTEAIVNRIGSAEAVIVNKTPITAATLAACPCLSYVGVLATGYNVVDIEAAKKHGITVTNIPAYGTATVAQMVFAHLLAVCHHVEAHSTGVHKGDWIQSIDFCYWQYPLIELEGKVLGIIGFGRIGKAVAKIANAFGMEVLAYDEYPAEEGKKLARYVGLAELYAESDVISLHCPLLPATEGLINKSSILQMKDGVILINTARGSLVVEADLAEALRAGKVAYACLDVVSTEPMIPDNPLLGVKNCLITPHIAWASKEARSRLMATAVSNLEGFLNGQPVNVVS